MPNTIEWIMGAAPGISSDLLNEPFQIRAQNWVATPSNRLEITIGPGRLDFSDTTTVRLGIIPYGATVLATFPSPAANTTYYVFIKQNNNNPMLGTDFDIRTTPIPAFGEVRIGSVTTPSAFGACTRSDLRGLLPVASAGGVSPGGTNPAFKIWVQAGDPGGAAADGDLWVHG
jgi:hypothetical protein